MRKKLAMMLLSLSVIVNIFILSLDNETPKNLESYSEISNSTYVNHTRIDIK